MKTTPMNNLLEMMPQAKGFMCTILSGILIFITAASVKDIQIVVSGILAAGSAIMAMRYYHVAYLEKKESLKVLKQKNKNPQI